MAHTQHKNDDWDKLNKEQQQEVVALRDRMNRHMIAETEAFYAQHPELKLLWSFSCNVSIRAIPKYTIGDNVQCKVEGVLCSGVIEQYTSDWGTVIYHVDVTIPGIGLLPIFVEESEIVGLSNA